MHIFIKKIIILIIIFITAFLFWHAVGPWVENPFRLSDIGVWLQPLIFLIVLSSLVGLSYVFIAEIWLKNLVFAAVALPAVVLIGFGPYFLSILAITFLFNLHAINAIRQATEERTKIRAGTILRSGMPSIISPLLIVISLIYFLTPSIQSSAKNNELPPTVNNVIEKTVDTFLGSQITQLPPKQAAAAKNEILKQVMEQITGLLQPFIKWLPPILAFGLFLVLQGFSFLFVRLSVWLGTLIFWILLRAGVLRIEKTQVDAERIVL